MYKRQGYRVFRDEVLHMNPEDRGFVDKLYKVYGMQGYLQTYARRLMQATLKEGKSSYQQKVPVLYLSLIHILCRYSPG